MSRIDQLSEITDHVLSGLQADESLKYRIYQKAADPSAGKERKSLRLPLAALCSISAVMIAVFVLLGQFIPFSGNTPAAPSAPTSYESGLSSFGSGQMGSELTDSPVDGQDADKDADKTEEPEENDQVSGDEDNPDGETDDSTNEKREEP